MVNEMLAKKIRNNIMYIGKSGLIFTFTKTYAV